MDYTYRIKTENYKKFLDENAFMKYLRKHAVYDVEDPSTFVVAREDHQKLIADYLASDHDKEHRDFTAAYAYMIATGQSVNACAMSKASVTFSNEIVSANKRLANPPAGYSAKKKLLDLRMVKKTPFTLKPAVTYTSDNDPPLAQKDYGTIVKPLSGRDLIAWRKLHKASGLSTIKVVANSLHLFATSRIVFPLLAPPLNPAVRDAIHEFMPDVDLNGYLMTRPSARLICERLQQYNYYAVRPMVVNPKNLQSFLGVLRDAGTIAPDGLVPAASVRRNPKAVCFGNATVNGVDLTEGGRYGDTITPGSKTFIGDMADLEFKNFMDGTYESENPALHKTILATWNQRLVRGKLEPLKAEYVNGLFEVKLLRTFASGQNCARTAEQRLLQPFDDALIKDAETRRAQGLKASMISGVTWNSSGIRKTLSYLLHRHSGKLFTKNDLLESVFACIDRKRMEMTTQAMTRLALWTLVRLAFRIATAGSSEKKMFELIVAQNQKPVSMVFSGGAVHFELTGGQVLSGEGGTFILDHIDNVYHLENLCCRDEWDLTYINGGDDGAVNITPLESMEGGYESFLAEIERKHQTSGVIWTDLEKRRVLTMSLESLAHFIEGETVQDLYGQEVNPLTAHDLPYFTIYGMVPCVVWDGEDLHGSFPVYNIKKILCSWYQPSARGEKMSADELASVRAIGMNLVIGMFRPLNALFARWVAEHPLTKGRVVSDILGEFAEHRPDGADHIDRVIDAIEVMDMWMPVGSGLPTSETPALGDDWLAIMEGADMSFLEKKPNLPPSYEEVQGAAKACDAIEKLVSALASSFDTTEKLKELLNLNTSQLKSRFRDISMKAKDMKPIIAGFLADHMEGCVVEVPEVEDGMYSVRTEQGLEVVFEGKPKTKYYLWCYAGQHGLVSRPKFKGLDIQIEVAEQPDVFAGPVKHTFAKPFTHKRTAGVSKSHSKKKQSKAKRQTQERKHARKARREEEAYSEDEFVDEYSEEDY